MGLGKPPKKIDIVWDSIPQRKYQQTMVSAMASFRGAASGFAKGIAGTIKSHRRPVAAHTSPTVSRVKVSNG